MKISKFRTIIASTGIHRIISLKEFLRRLPVNVWPHEYVEIKFYKPQQAFWLVDDQGKHIGEESFHTRGFQLRKAYSDVDSYNEILAQSSLFVSDCESPIDVFEDALVNQMTNWLQPETIVYLGKRQYLIVPEDGARMFFRESKWPINKDLEVLTLCKYAIRFSVPKSKK